jgi:hypothetical protein
MRAWANLGDLITMPTEVFRNIDNAGLLQSLDLKNPDYLPDTPAEFLARLDEVDGDTALRLLTSLATTTLAYSTPGRYDPEKAGEVLSALSRLLGPGTRWWTNTDLTSWNPVTRHAVDAA